VLAACPALRYIGVCATSTACIDTAEAARRGIAMTTVEDYGDEATAEFIMFSIYSREFWAVRRALLSSAQPARTDSRYRYSR
jgi:phosphoglycerate dehydrogenase-like enzyme